LLSAFVIAQAAAPAVVVQQPAVVVYGPEFFADAAPSNALEMATRLPGFILDTGVGVRGFDGAAGNVLIDGQRPVTKTETVQDLLRRIPASQVSHIDLIRGGAPGIDMQGKSALANIILKQAGGWRAAITAGNQFVYDGRNYPTLRFESSGESGGKSWELGAVYANSAHDGSGEGPHIRITPTGAPIRTAFRDSDGARGERSVTGAVQLPLAGGKLRLNGRVYSTLFDYDDFEVVSFPAKPTPDTARDRDDIDGAEFGARYGTWLGTRTDIQTLALFTAKRRHIGSDREDATGLREFDSFTRNREGVGRAVVKFRQTERLYWEFGGEGAYNTQRSRTAILTNGAPVAVPAANTRAEELRGEVFLKAVGSPTRTLTLEAAVRQEGSHIESKGDVALAKTLYFTKPRLAATWSPNDRTQVRLRIERTVGQLDFNDFAASGTFNRGVVSAGNPDIVPSRSWIYEAGIEQRFLGSAALTAAIRHHEISDVIDRIPVGDFDAPGNVGKGTKDELAVTLTLPLDRFGLKGVVVSGESTWRRSSVVDPTNGEKRPISYARPIDWKAHLTHDLPQWKLTWGLDVYGGRRDTAYRIRQREDYKDTTYLVFFADWKPKPDIVVHVEASNPNERAVRRVITQWTGPRGLSPIAYTDYVQPRFGRMFLIRVRKSFGG
jgi:hypothetical protein